MKGTFWKKYGKEQLCGISHSRLRSGRNKDGKPYVVFLKCKHGFYRKPLSIWVEKHNTCPICRKIITDKFLSQIVSS